VEVPEGGSPDPVEVEMRSIDEATPLAWEESRTTIVRWLELGNALLQQGRPAAARAEYEKALAALPAAERPPVLEAIARTHFVEGNGDEAVASLRRALALAPHDPDLRELFRLLLTQLDRAAEAEEVLAAAAAGALVVEEQAVAEEEPEWPPEVRRWIDAEAVALEAGLVGRAKVRLEGPSPLGALDVFWSRSGFSPADFPAARVHDPAAESYQLYVPAQPPAAGYGLLVWVSPTEFGGFSQPAMAELLERSGLIWVGADGAGNARPAWQRWGVSLDAAEAIGRHYKLDRRRIYVAGYSGGGRTASSLATLYPEVFRGAFSWFGVNHFHAVPVPDKPGAHWPADFPEPPAERLAEVRDSGRFVLLTGARDFNRSQTKATWRHLNGDGFAHLTYIEIPGADHYFGVPAEWMEKGIAALDAALR
jgi:tetratricopeptide (TPR) repeat protein